MEKNSISIIKNGQWIGRKEKKDVCPVFIREFSSEKEVRKAVLYATARGVYKAFWNGTCISDYVLAPGWTVYEKRLQVQTYDVTSFVEKDNRLEIVVGKGWFSSPMPGWMESENKIYRKNRKNGLLAVLELEFTDGTTELIPTDEQWKVADSNVLFSEIYDGEIYDAAGEPGQMDGAVLLPELTKDNLICQEGKKIVEQEHILPKEIITTPAGETVIDFGQEVTGYVEISLTAKAGDVVEFTHGEVLDQNGNFYNENYRSAKAVVKYICREGEQIYHPLLTFFGFRYIKLLQFPGKVEKHHFKAIVVGSELERTGYVECGNSKVNQLFSNIYWGQKGNFLDVPTDCPQRDERLGWTGDAQVFAKTASLQFDVEQFFKKWLADLKADQRADGGVGQVIPDYLPEGAPSAAWGDAATIIPWQMYLTYGNSDILADQFDSMKAWVDYITNATTTPYLWTGGEHFGDWLGLDAPQGSYKGASREEFIASAFYAHSTSLVVKAGKVIGADVSEYEALLEHIRKAFLETYTSFETQTECVLALQFHLTDDEEKTARKLADLIEGAGNKMQTGFVGTPYLLHVLTDHGYEKLAYDLFLREEYPSWLYSVNQGATTIWEHWDGIMENGEFWSADMNSFNHYAYGSVADWVYEKAAGIQVSEEQPGYQTVKIAPHPDERLGWLDVRFHSKHGQIHSKWNYTPEGLRYEIAVDMPAVIVIDGKEHPVAPGSYIFWN